MITADTLSVEIGARFPNTKRISSTAVRAERADDLGNPFAVYYFALSDDIADWASHIEERQDEMIGPSYFETPGDLRWNHYLYLIVDSDKSDKSLCADQKRKIEGNLSYARKFVINQTELPALLGQIQTPTSKVTQTVAPDIAGKWVELLLQARLGLILDQLPIAETVRAISGGLADTQPAKADQNRKPKQAQPLAEKFLDAIDLVHFRNWPSKRSFDSLGTVNLIVGSNGVGKTTLLEAIEYVYCQENVRTVTPVKAHIRVRLKGTATWFDAKSPTKSSDAKQR
ncbi:AAA family ATPase, partial [Limnobacter sp.]|uniref:AAA family ATPase n=1 Tax=Limnobacter sp. TaxID=2003368 RepID=UPI0027331EF2